MRKRAKDEEGEKEATRVPKRHPTHEEASEGITYEEKEEKEAA